MPQSVLGELSAGAMPQPALIRARGYQEHSVHDVVISSD